MPKELEAKPPRRFGEVGVISEADRRAALKYGPRNITRGTKIRDIPKALQKGGVFGDKRNLPKAERPKFGDKGRLSKEDRRKMSGGKR